MLSYSVRARRIDSHGAIASTRAAEVLLDTDVQGRDDAFNPAELLLAAIAACMIKSIERVRPMLEFDLRGVDVRIHGLRQDSPPKLVSIDYEILVDTDEADHRLDLLHTNVRKFGTISNTVAQATQLNGTLRRKPPATAEDAQEHSAEIQRAAELSRRKLDEVAPPGTDTLHEGP